VILETAESSGCNLLFLGGFSFRSVKHMMLGSTVERILREYRHPMWICR
jgi:nucleotide-binding universal stress UspA family protein